MDLMYWYCGTDDIGAWGPSNIDVYVGTNSQWSALSTSNIRSYISTALQSWNVTGMSFSYVSNQSSADLVIGGITRDQATDIGISPSALGITISQMTLTELELYFGNQQKNYYQINSCTIFLIESQNNGTNFSTTEFRKVAVHEIGHGLGYLGHYEAGNVMPSIFSNIVSTTPSQNEKNHLGQVY